MSIFEDIESNVRSYCRDFPDVFQMAKGSKLYTEAGKEYIDFFAGAGALNYGHNNEFIKGKIISYLINDGITHALDMYTKAKRDFLDAFLEYILKPKKLDYKVQFCGPTGTNAVEAALKLARKVKKRPGVFSFMGAFHGMSLGSLSCTSNIKKRAGGGIPLDNVTFMPYPYGFMNTFDTIEYIETILSDDHAGIERPAAIIIETVQAEGGVVVAPVEWLQKLARVCEKYDILFICDEIQVGCGRTGPFFSFERAGIVPDIVLLSKSISGYGLPMSLLLMKPDLDVWQPGEHNGTFRGNQLAFVGAAAALQYREAENLEQKVSRKEKYLREFLQENIALLSPKINIRGIGLIYGIDLSAFGRIDLAKKVAARCYELGLVIETSGRSDAVIKIMPPLTIESDILEKGCQIIKHALIDCI